jgi:ubiquinone/menaquinone biosynthesis C-methylase UbiE
LPAEKDIHRKEPKALQALCDLRGRRVVEIGSGEGRLTRWCAESAAFVLAIDTSQAQIEIAERSLPDTLCERVRFAAMPAEHLPRIGERFEIALLSHSL